MMSVTFIYILESCKWCSARSFKKITSYFLNLWTAPFHKDYSLFLGMHAMLSVGLSIFKQYHTLDGDFEPRSVHGHR